MDLPVWAMGSSFDYHLPNIPMSLDFPSPWMQQSTAHDADDLRFIEINDDDETAKVDQCKILRFLGHIANPGMLTLT